MSGLTDRLAWEYVDMRSISGYFHRAKAGGKGIGMQRMWDLSVYSDEVRKGIYLGQWKNGGKYDEWNIVF